MTQRAGILARISKKDKKVPKVENQVLICKQIADEHGYTIDPRHIFIDDGIAASGKDVDDTTLENRPGSRACIAAMRAGEFDVLIAVEGERLARTYLDGLEFIKASVEGGVTWHLDTDGPLDPRSPAGEETAVSIFASGRREGRVRTARQRRRYDRELAEGMPLWNVRPFGYEDRIHIRESEAVHIRQAVRDYLDGSASMTSLAKRWNALGLKTDGMQRPRRRRGDGPGAEQKDPLYNYWTATTVHRVLLRERNAGILMNNGVEMPNSQIEPIITQAEFESLKARVKVGTPMGARAKTELGGILRCECGAPMHGTIAYSQRKGGPRHEYRVYQCSQTRHDKTRKHASINATIADDKVRTEVIAHIGSGALRDDSAPDFSQRLTEIADRLAELTEQESRAEDALIEGLGDAKRIKGKLAAIRAEREEILEERNLLDADRAGVGVLRTFEIALDLTMAAGNEEATLATVARAFDHWDALPLEDRQAITRGRFTITCVTGGRGPDRVTVQRRDWVARGIEH